MRPIILSLLLTACATTSPSTLEDDSAASFKTDKALPAIEQCLTDRLSKSGDVTAMNTGGTTTLLYRDSTQKAMLIDLAPPSVTVTTKFSFGTRDILESCL